MKKFFRDPLQVAIVTIASALILLGAVIALNSIPVRSASVDPTASEPSPAQVRAEAAAELAAANSQPQSDPGEAPAADSPPPSPDFSEGVFYVARSWEEARQMGLYEQEDGAWEFYENTDHEAEPPHQILLADAPNADHYTVTVTAHAHDGNGELHICMMVQPDGQGLRLAVGRDATKLESASDAEEQLSPVVGRGIRNLNDGEPEQWRVEVDTGRQHLQFFRNNELFYETNYNPQPPGGQFGVGGDERRPIWKDFDVQWK